MLQQRSRDRRTRPSDIAPKRITDGIKPVRIPQVFTAPTNKTYNAMQLLIQAIAANTTKKEGK